MVEPPISSEPLEPAGVTESGVFDFETEGGGIEGPPPGEMPVPPSDELESPPAEDDFEELGPPTDEAPRAEAPVSHDYDDEAEEEPDFERDAGEGQGAPGEELSASDVEAEDLLAGSPDFADDSEEDEDLWFERKPPEDFDFEEK